MPFSQFTPRVLTGVINLRPVNPRLFTSFFKENAPSPVDTFELETFYQGQSVLPALSYNQAGTMRDSGQRSIRAVVAPIFRPKRSFTAAEKFKRAKGMTPYDGTTGIDEAIAEDMDAHLFDLEFMKEIMCSQALVHGKITLLNKLDDNVVEIGNIDFKRPASHSITLSDTAQWSNAASDIVSQADQYSSMIMEATGGFGATDIIMGKKAFALFRKHKDVQDLLDNRNIHAGELNLTVRTMYKGNWNGLNIWLNSASYRDMKGQNTPFIPEDMALFVARDARLEIDYALPTDVECTGATRYFAKQFKQEDPSAYFTVAESRPLPQVKHNGATVAVKVGS